ncbi:phosphatidylserine/phosphatidylglycerophosphate/cardiolipin synthase family protein [Nanoarchaeota archaeon]
MLAEIFNDKKILRQIKEILYEIFDEKSILSGQDIINNLKPVTKEVNSSALLYSFLDKGILIKKSISEDIHKYTFSFDASVFDDYVSLELKKLGSIPEEPEEPKLDEGRFEIIATVPEDENYHSPEQIKNLISAINRQILETKQEILMAVPFFDTIGIDAVIEELITVAKKGIVIKLITREVFIKSENGRRVVNSLKRIREEFKKEDVLSKLFVRDYHIINEETGKQQSSLHAKLFIFDNKRAYIGSANLTYPSLYYNFELGVIIEKENLGELRAAFHSLWDLAKQVNLNSL